MLPPDRKVPNGEPPPPLLPPDREVPNGDLPPPPKEPFWAGGVNPPSCLVGVLPALWVCEWKWGRWGESGSRYGVRKVCVGGAVDEGRPNTLVLL